MVPLRWGAGVKGKVNSAMSHGVPVVCTSVAQEGMHLVDGVDALVADHPRAFAAKVDGWGTRGEGDAAVRVQKIHVVCVCARGAAYCSIPLVCRMCR